MGSTFRARSCSFKRAMAVALAAGLAFNGMQAVAPAHSNFAAVSSASDTEIDQLAGYYHLKAGQGTVNQFPEDDPELLDAKKEFEEELAAIQAEAKEQGYKIERLDIRFNEYDHFGDFPEWVTLNEDGSFTVAPSLDVKPGLYTFHVLLTVDFKASNDEETLEETYQGYVEYYLEVESTPKPQARAITATVGDPAPNPEQGISNFNDLPHGTKVAWLNDAATDTIGKKTHTAVVTYPDGSTVNINIPITVLVGQEDYEATLGEIKDLQNQADALNKQLNTGLARCVGTVGGSLLALMPAIAITSQLVGGLRYPALDSFIADVQKQIGAFHPGLAKAVDNNRAAIAAAFAGIAVTGLALTPLTCRDASLGEAIAEPLSSH